MKHPKSLGQRLLSMLLVCMMLLSMLPVSAFAADAGKFALLAVNADKQIIEPCYVSYQTNDTVKDALQRSGHEFSGIDKGYITAIDGHEDNYSLHYDENKADLNAPAAAVHGLWLTTNNAQDYGTSLLELVQAMAKFNTTDNGVKDYAAAKDAYAAAVKGFYKADDKAAAPLAKALNDALQSYEQYLKGETVPVTMKVTLDGKAVTPDSAEFIGEFGNKVSVEANTTAKLIPGTYDYVITKDQFRHATGTVQVTGPATIEAQLPAGQWVKDVNTGIDSAWKQYGQMERDNLTAAGATFYIPDYASGDLFTNFTPAEAALTDTLQIFAPNSSSSRSWNSTVSVTSGQFEANSLQDATFDYKIVPTAEDANIYQSFTMHLVRTPSLKALTAASDGSELTLHYQKTVDGKPTEATGFDGSVQQYTLSTNGDSIDLTPTVLCPEATVTVNAHKATSSQAVHVPLSECKKLDENKYELPITLQAPNGRTTTYTVQVNQLPAAAVSITHDKDVKVEVFADNDTLVAPQKAGETQDTYRLIPGATYRCQSTKNTYYHARTEFKAADGQTIAAATPKVEDWITDLAACASAKDTVGYDMTPAFDPAVHEYTFTAEANTTAFLLSAPVRTPDAYTVTAFYTWHDNSSQPGREEARVLSKPADPVNLPNFLAAGGWGNQGRLEIREKNAADGVTYYQDYLITANRAMTMNTLTMADAQGNPLVLTQKDSEPPINKFNKLITDYTIKLGQRASEVQVTCKPQSSYKLDSGFIVTAACGDWSQEIRYSDELTPNTPQTIKIPLHPDQATEQLTLTVSHEREGSKPMTYTFTVVKLPPVETTITVEPADATIFLSSTDTKTRVLPEKDGKFILDTDTEYVCNVTKAGYVGQSITFVAGKDTQKQTIQLEKAASNPLPDLSQEGDWQQFRADNNNNGVVDVKTPIKAEDTVLLWANQLGEGYSSGAVGNPIIVGGYLYTYAGNYIMKVNKATGEVVASGKMAAASAFAINSPTYADGMIFVALSNGGVQAFDAGTLQSLWLYKDPLRGQPNCPITYANGYIYTGFWNSETKRANFVCLSVTDEAPAKTDELKIAAWTHTDKGFYWAGAYVNNDFLLIPTDDGERGYTTGHADLLSLQPKTGIVLDRLTMPGVGDLRSSVCYDQKTDAYYFTSKGGDFYRVKVNPDGTFVKDSLRQLHLDNGKNDPNLPPMSTSTPVIYAGRAYIGVSGESQFGAYSGHNMTVIDLDSFKIAYTVPTQGYPQVSGLLTTAYESTGYIYVYFMDNFTPGKVRVIRDQPGRTSLDPEYMTRENIGTESDPQMIDTGYVLFTPSGSQAQYAICSPIVDADGNIYFKNDSAQMMCLSNAITSLEVVKQPTKLKYKVGDTFDPTGIKVVAHYANGTQTDITDYLQYTTEPLTEDDTEITLSYDLDKLLQNAPGEDGSHKSFWQLYQDNNGQAATPYDLPVATVSIQLGGEPAAAQVITSLEQDNFYVMPPQNQDVSEDLSDTFGYVDQVKGAPSVLDSLIATHQTIFGEAFTPKTKDDFLMVNKSGFITKVMGEKTSSFGFAVNGMMPNDGVINEQYGTYTGYSANQAKLEKGDVVQFFFYNPAGYYGEIYTNFLQDGQHVTDLTAVAGRALELQVQGYSFMYEGCNPEIKWKNVTDAQVCLLEMTGENAGTLTPVDGAVTDEDGLFHLTFDKPGTYYLAVTSDPENLTYILPQICKVVVTAPSEDEKAALAVDKMIDSIGDVTPDKADAIHAARKAYEELTPAQKKLVTKLEVLDSAEKALEQLLIPVTQVSIRPSDGKPILTWNKVDGAVKYEVYRAVGEDGTFKHLFTTTGTRMTNTSAQAGVMYSYQVRAITANGTQGAFSAPVSSACTLAQTDLTVVIRKSDGKPILTWDKVDGATGYEVYRATSKDGTYTKIYTAKGTKLVNSSAKTGQRYYYKVRAIMGEDAFTAAFSNIVKATPIQGPLCAPSTKLTIVSSNGKPRLTWNKVDGAVKYEVYRAIGKNGTFKRLFTTTGTRMTNTSAEVGETYYYKVRAIANDGGKSDFSATKRKTCDCARPTVKITLRSDGAPVLTWNKIDGATGYEVYRATSKDGTYTKIYTAKGTKLTNGSAKAGQRYYYKVRAIHADNKYATGAFSSIVNIRAK